MAQTERVRAVLFFALTCPHCHDVIQNHLPDLFRTHGGLPETQLAWGATEDSIAVYYVANEQIELLLVDVASPAGNDLYTASAEAFSIPPDRQGVPRLIIGNTVLVGSLEIPTHLPDMVEQGVGAGGIDWPDIPGLNSVVANFAAESQRLAEAGVEEPPAEDPSAEDPDLEEPAEEERAPEAEGADDPEPTKPASVGAEQGAVTAQPEPAEPEPEVQPATTSPAGFDTGVAAAESEVGVTSGVEPADVERPRPAVFESLPERRASPMENFRNDPVGNGMSVVVLIGMLLCVAAVVGYPKLRTGRQTLTPIVLFLAVLGLGVAGYLAYIEMTRSLAVCGPVGDCNTVQQSVYARLFGLIPVGVLGLLGYVVIVAAWWASRLADPQTADVAKVAVLLMSFMGTLFSIYLTFLEPFVIGATCAWCLTSSIVITVLMVLSLSPAAHAWARLRGSDYAH